MLQKEFVIVLWLSIVALWPQRVSFSSPDSQCMSESLRMKLVANMDAETLRQSLQEQTKTVWTLERAWTVGQFLNLVGHGCGVWLTNSYLQAPQKQLAVAVSEDIAGDLFAEQVRKRWQKFECLLWQVVAWGCRD